jgi:DNA mismatch repair protein MLH1
LIYYIIDFFVERPAADCNKPVAEYHYVRTDSTRTTMDRFLNNKPSLVESNDAMEVDKDNVIAENAAPPEQQQIEVVKGPRVEVRLGSVLQLRKDLKKEESAGTVFVCL